jgi:pimeloyl-ACP methyl ester carboxylesterase
MADDAMSILDAEGIGRCHIVGHSMGGLIAAQVALMSPRRVRSLTLLCTFPDGKTGARLTSGTFVTGLRTRIGTKAMRRRAFMSLVTSKSGMRRGLREQLLAEMTELFGRDLADQPAIVMKQLRAMSRFDASWRLRCLAPVRTLVVSAEEDRIARPEHGRKLAAAIPGATYIELANQAHAVPIESPALINRLLTEQMGPLKLSAIS